MLRRQFLAWAAGAVGATAAGGLYYRRRASAQAAGAPEHPRYASAAGILETSIGATYGWVDIGGRTARLSSFNGRVPGPILEVKAGDTVRLHLNNHLPEATNLHYHGLHIPPTGNADNIFLTVPSGESLTYEFTLPRNHPAGLFWYHPHLHGFSAKQVSMGLAAPLVVRGDLDRLLEVAAAREQFLVLQDFSLSSGGTGTHMRGRGSSQVAVSGRFNPEFPIQQNGLVWLRFLNASSWCYHLRDGRVSDPQCARFRGTRTAGSSKPIASTQSLV